MKFFSIEFRENPSSGSRPNTRGQIDIQTDGRTDKHDDVNRRFSRVCESAWNCNVMLL